MQAQNIATRASRTAGVEKVKVYKFKRYSPATGECFPSHTYATQEAIERADAAIIVNSAVEVDPSEVYANGTCDPERIKQQIIHSHAPKEMQQHRRGL